MKRTITTLCMLALFGMADAQLRLGSAIEGEAADDLAGSALCMPDANTIAIGAQNNDGNGGNAGHVRIFIWNGNDWVQKGADIEGDSATFQSGKSVTMPDANTVAIGAGSSHKNGFYAGQVKVYSWNGNAWVQKGGDLYGEASEDMAGADLSMPDANTLAIGATGHDGSANNAGRVSIYTWNGSNWVIKGLPIDGEEAFDVSGGSVDMPDANTVAIGATGHKDNDGQVRVFTWDGNSWVQKGLEIEGDTMNDRLAWDLSMPDANTLAVGIPYHDGNGTDAGSVRVFSWSGTAWVQKGLDIEGNAAGDAWGYSVSMPTPDILAIGAPLRDGNGTNSGEAYLFEWSGTAWVQKGNGFNGYVSNGSTGLAVFMPDSLTLAVGSARNHAGSASGSVAIYSLCGNYSAMNAKSCNPYVSPSGRHIWDQSGLFLDTLTNSAGCDSVLYIQLSIEPLNVTISEVDSLLQVGETGAKYQWVRCLNQSYSLLVGDTNRTFHPAEDGFYAVVVTSNGCSDTSDCFPVLTGSTSSQYSLRANIFPNPTNGDVVIRLEGVSGTLSVTVHNVLGQKLTEEIQTKEKEIMLSIPGGPGCYFVEVRSSEGQIARLKVMKE